MSDCEILMSYLTSDSLFLAYPGATILGEMLPIAVGCITIACMIWVLYWFLQKKRGNDWMVKMRGVLAMDNPANHYDAWRPCPRHEYVVGTRVDSNAPFTMCECDGFKKWSYYRYEDDEQRVVEGQMILVDETLFVVGGEYGNQVLVRPVGRWRAAWCKNWWEWLLGYVGFSWPAIVIRWDHSLLASAANQFGKSGSVMNIRNLDAKMPSGDIQQFGLALWFFERARVLKSKGAGVYANDDLDITSFLRLPAHVDYEEVPCEWDGDVAKPPAKIIEKLFGPAPPILPLVTPEAPAPREVSFYDLSDYGKELLTAFTPEPPIRDYPPIELREGAPQEPGVIEMESIVVMKEAEPSYAEPVVELVVQDDENLKRVVPCDGHVVPTPKEECAHAQLMEELGEPVDQETLLMEGKDDDKVMVEYHQLPTWNPGVVQDGRVDLHHSDAGTPSGIRVVGVDPRRLKTSARNGIAVGNLFGHSGMVLRNDSHNLVNTMRVRYVAKEGVKAEAAVMINGKMCARPLSLPVPQFVKEGLEGIGDVFDVLMQEGKFTYETKFSELYNKMKTASRDRVIRTINNYIAGEIRHVDKIVKVFIKSDEKLGKKKGRLIIFVPTIGWVMTILEIDRVMKAFKGEEFQAIVNPKLNLTYMLGCGFSQDSLCAAATEAELRIQEGRNVVFVCGDDNTSGDTEEDVSSYDVSQGGVFLSTQKQWLAALTSREVSWWTKHFMTHYGSRSGAGVSVKQDGYSLPSGATWTLLVNTLGDMIYITARQWAVENYGLSQEDAATVAARWFGLSMTVEPPLYTGTLVGKTFLKGVFVPDRNRIIWAPLPSRICKTGGRILGNPDNQWLGDSKLLWAHTKGVCQGYEAMVLDPLITRAYIDSVLKCTGSVKAMKQKTGFNLWEKDGFVDEGAQEIRKKGWSDHAVSWWRGYLEQRYDIHGSDVELFNSALASMGPNKQGFLRMWGGCWFNLMRVDYGAEPLSE